MNIEITMKRIGLGLGLDVGLSTNDGGGVKMAKELTEYQKMELTEAMDAAAKVAEADLKAMSQHVTVPVARWFKTHYMKAGHKRLGRIMVAFAKAMEGTGPHNWADADEVPVGKSDLEDQDRK